MISKTESQLIAHISKEGRRTQPLIEHLQAVSKKTGEFAEKIGMKETGLLIGLLHDFGKASDKFQNYLLSEEGVLDPDEDGYTEPGTMRGKIDHSTAGAQIVFESLWTKGKKEKIAAQVIALCLASHHSGLIDCVTPDGENNFQRRMSKGDEDTHKVEALNNLNEFYLTIKDLLSQRIVDQIFTKLCEIREENADSQETLLFKYGMLVRFLFSCLIDADRLDAADFESPGDVEIRNYGNYHPWQVLIDRLEYKIRKLEGENPKNEVNLLRAEVSKACLDFASKPKGIYQLTVPTGGGKTLSSLRFALHHAKQHGLERVFYIIPYTSIIDQNAEEVRKILEDKDEAGKYLDRVVLEHHSNLTPEEESCRQNLLAQNWDAPIVFTTQVQFLEALFGAGTRSARRMHQLANSVVILDEVQTLPINMIHMLNLALRFLVHTCGSTVILSTATQPPLDKLENPYRALIVRSEQHIIQNELELFRKMKRVEVLDERKIGGWSEDETAELAILQLEEKGSVLIVVNTRKSARALYDTIHLRKMQQICLYHLSTNMCPAHRMQVLTEVKEKLKSNQPVICVSTQLIEAGVDIDFGTVIRYLAGMDSIVQSAGRCNRHGVREGLGKVWIINPRGENIEILKDIAIGIEQSQRILDDFKDAPQRFGSDRIGLEVMKRYYENYYFRRKDEMCYKVGPDAIVGKDDDLFNLLSKNKLSLQEYERKYQKPLDLVFPQSFQTAAREFRVINSPTCGIVVQYGEQGKKLVADLCSAILLEKQYDLLKKAQRYSVNLFPHEVKKLVDKQAIHEVQKGTGVFFLDEEFYSCNFGWNDEPVSAVSNYIV